MENTQSTTASIALRVWINLQDTVHCTDLSFVIARTNFPRFQLCFSPHILPSFLWLQRADTQNTQNSPKLRRTRCQSLIKNVSENTYHLKITSASNFNSLELWDRSEKLLKYLFGRWLCDTRLTEKQLSSTIRRFSSQPIRRAHFKYSEKYLRGKLLFPFPDVCNLGLENKRRGKSLRQTYS